MIFLLFTLLYYFSEYSVAQGCYGPLFYFEVSSLINGSMHSQRLPSQKASFHGIL